jgi:zona occludens toxin
MQLIEEALQQGRTVITNVDGINIPGWADYLDMEESEIEKKIKIMTEDDVMKPWEIAEKDSLMIIDEIQDYYPATRTKPDPELSKFVSRHGHDGMDILIMGQSIEDCHNIWKRRIDRKVVFQKLDAVGKPESYTWKMMKRIHTGKSSDLKFEKVSRSTEKYNEKYFGLYKSHSDGTKNKSVMKDDRATIFSDKWMKYAVTVVLIFTIGGIWAIKSF